MVADQISPPAAALAYFRAGKIEQARHECEQVLRSDTTNVGALHLLAITLGRLSLPEASEQAYRRALVLAPQAADILVDYGNLLWKLARHEEAGEVLEKAVLLKPELGRAWELRAAIEQKVGNLAAAKQVCRDGIVALPNHPRLCYSLGQLHRQDCEFSAAAAAYESALRRGFDPSELYRNLSEAWMESGNTESAVRTALLGVRRWPDDANNHENYLRLHWELGMPGDSFEELRTAVRERPGNTSLVELLVTLMEIGGLCEKGLFELERVESRIGELPPSLLLIRARLKARQGEPQAAGKLFEYLLQQQPGNSRLELGYAEFLLTYDNPAGTVDVCKKILQHNPFDQLALAYLVTAWECLGDERSIALMDYQRVIGHYQLATPEGYAGKEDYLHALKDVLLARHHSQRHPIDQTLIGGTQTNGNLFRYKEREIQQLQAQVMAALHDFIKSFPDHLDHPFWGRKSRIESGKPLRINGAWSVKLGKGGFHRNHVHPAGWISAVCYVALPLCPEQKRNAKRPGNLQFGVPLLMQDRNFSPHKTIVPAAGDIVFFPSYCWHGTLPSIAVEPRLTVALDFALG